MQFDFSRLQRGDVIAAIGGMTLLVSLFLPWFDGKQGSAIHENLCGESSCSSFDTFHLFTLCVIPGLDLLLPAAAGAPLILGWIIIRGRELPSPPGEVTAI